MPAASASGGRRRPRGRPARRPASRVLRRPRRPRARSGRGDGRCAGRSPAGRSRSPSRRGGRSLRRDGRHAADGHRSRAAVIADRSIGSGASAGLVPSALGASTQGASSRRGARSSLGRSSLGRSSGRGPRSQSPSRRGGRSSRGRSSQGRSSRGGATGGGVDAAASRIGALPPSAWRGAATIRAGSAPMPRTPRLPGVRISKSGSLSSTLKASRAAFRASSTDLPVEFLVCTHGQRRLPRRPLSAAPFTGTDRRRGFAAAFVGLSEDRIRRSFRRVRDGDGHREARRVAPGEGRVPTEQGEHPAPANDQVLLDR